MSYARFGWGGCDVYVFANLYGGLECCGCRLRDGHHFNTRGGTVGDESELTREDYTVMLGHLADHTEAGHFVPLYCTERLRAELDGDLTRPLSPEAKAHDEAAARDMADKLGWTDEHRLILGIPLMREGDDGSPPSGA